MFAIMTVFSGLMVPAGIPKLLHTSGHQFAAEVLLLGRNVTAVEARDRFRL
jgi:hypothetical protein